MNHPERTLRRVLVTGGCGFIGTNFIRYLFEKTEFSGKIINLDKLTYAGNPKNLEGLAERYGAGRYRFLRGDIGDAALVEKILREEEVDTIVHFAAESHVDRSIRGPEEFVRTNVLGTFTLLEAARKVWESSTGKVFHHVSTDEVFGSLGQVGFFTEGSPYDPRSPYSASKASSDHLVRAYFHTYHLPVMVSNCSNNYGPYQFPEKMIPLMVLNALEGKPLPVYGEGTNVRDWLHVEDHCSALWAILNRGRLGETYAVGGRSETSNLRLVESLCDILERRAPESRPQKGFRSLITFVKDRPGHDQRYAIDCRKIEEELGWKRSFTLAQGLEETLLWYLHNRVWCDEVRRGDYAEWIRVHYGSGERE